MAKNGATPSLRSGLLLIIAAPLILVLSMLFLANTLVNSPESLAYQIGQVICFIGVPIILLSGVAICVRAHSKKKMFEKTISPEFTAKTEPEKTEKRKTPMPPWMVWTRRILATILTVWITVMIAFFTPAAFTMYAPHIVASLVVVAYTFSKKRGIAGTAVTVLVSVSVFANLIYYPLILFFGPTPLGIPKLVDDWAAGRDPYAVENILLVVRSGLLFSTGLAVFTTFILGLKRLRKFEAKRVTKILTVGVILLPIIVMCLLPTGEGAVDPSVTRPWGIGGRGGQGLSSDFNSTRIYENGRWVYSLYLYNRGSENTTILKIWAWHEAVEPLSTRVTFNGTGISVSDQGINFEPGASGVITFATEQGHNRVTLLLPDKSINTFSW